MASVSKVCPECGLQLEVGLANCMYCGAQVGTLFSEKDAVPDVSRARYRQHIAAQAEYYQSIDKARERANASSVLALASFFLPLLGAVLALVSVYWGVTALRTLKANHIHEGRGSATSGVVIGGLALVAQFCYLIYFVKMGFPLVG